VNVVGVSGAASIDWGLSGDLLPEGLSMNVAWSPKASGALTNDKGVGGAGNSVTGSGYDVVLQHSGLMDGLNIFGGWSAVEQAANAASGDKSEKTLGATYATGGLTFGYQYSISNHNNKLSTATDEYENTLYGVSFAVNDDLSLSYGVQTSDRKLVNGTNVEAEVNSLQVAYSMGGASIKLAESDADNINYGTADRGATTLALTLAF
jgi:outer membrane protein OmpU